MRRLSLSMRAGSSLLRVPACVRLCTNTPPTDSDVVVEPPSSDVAPESDSRQETLVGSGEEFGFKTETKQLLDIVACSLYSEKEVFIRELVSNASDALEKRRHLELKNSEDLDEAGTPCITIACNQSKSKFTITDNGLGMTRQELMDNLGTIAASGSKAFVRQLQENAQSSTAAADKIIGQFGVGFYSAFMVARSVKVYSRSATKGSKGYLWESDGAGLYRITECEGIDVGTKITLEVKDTELSFCTPQVVERVLKKYSNFVNYDIKLNGAKVNTVEALWMRGKDEISNEEHIDFYKFVSSAYDSPLFRLHYSVDAPMTIRALLYVPQAHTEKYGGGRMESGVGLYCRRVLIQSKAKGLMPEWLRFLKGAVDCENIPLNISREHTQDGSTMRRLSSVITKKVTRWFEEESKRDRSKYERFIREFGAFLKEGVCTDQIHKMDIAKLLRFESTASTADFPLISLDDYRDRMQPNQTNMYYISAPSRDMALVSPYFEQYKEHQLEVLVLTEPVDDFVMQHMDTYAKHKLQNIEVFDANNDGSVQAKKKIEGASENVSVRRQLTTAQVTALGDFMTKRLVGRLGSVTATERLRDSPVLLCDHEAAQLRKIYRLTGQTQGPAPKYNLQINPQHEVIRKLYALSVSASTDDTETAGLIAEQLFDNAIIAAGLMEDPRTMVQRLNSLMGTIVKAVPDPPKGTDSTKDEAAPDDATSS